MKSGFWKRFRFWGAACGCVTLLGSLTASAAPGEFAAWGREPDADGLLVAFRETAPAPARVGVLQRLGLELAHSQQRFARLRLGAQARQQGKSLRSVLSQLRRDPNVRVAEPDFRVRATAVPNDPGFPHLWGLHNTGQTGGAPDADIDALEAWDKTTGSSQVIVAVLDTGVDTSHPDLTDNILRDAQGKVVGYDFANGDSNPADDNGHGSHCAGTIGARGNNLKGVVGVCHQVKIMPVKFLNASGNGDTSGAIAAIDYAVQRGAHILNNSWGGGGYSQLLAEAIQRARSAGVLFVAAAGNDSSYNDNLPTFPANYNQVLDNVISVAATTDQDTLAYFSNWGPRTVDLAAPGQQIYSTHKNGTYATLDGTSMATPHVAGAAALVKARFPQLTYSQIKTRLLANTDRPAALEGKVRMGRLNVNAALVEDTTPPGAPTGLTATHRSSDALLLGWTASGDDGAVGTVTQYELRYSTSPLSEANFHLAAAAAELPVPAPSGWPQSYLLSGLTPGTTYYVALRAIDRVGTYSTLATFGPISTSPASATVVPVSDDAEGPAQFVGDDTWARTTEAFLSPSHSYADSPGTSYAPNTDSSLTLATTVLLQGFAPRLEFRIKHALEEGYDSLFVEATRDGGFTWERLPVAYTGANNIWDAETVSLGSFYGSSIRVRFRLVSDNIVHHDGVWLDDVRICGSPLQPISGPPVPAAPSGFTAVATGQTAVHLNWSDNSSDEEGFRLDRRLGSTGAWSTLATTAADVTSWEDSVQANTAYTYRLVAFNAAGDSTAVVAVVTTPAFPPATPTNLQAAGGSGSISLIWDGVAGATSYTLRRGTSPDGPFSVYKSGLTVTSHVDTAVTVGTPYYYTVSALNTGGESAPSAVATAAAQPLPPAAPSNVKAKRNSAKKSTVTWTQSAGPNLAKYRIYRSTAQSGPWSLLAEINPTTKYADTTLVKKTAYYYTVTAVNGTGQESPRSNAAFVKKK